MATVSQFTAAMDRLDAPWPQTGSGADGLPHSVHVESEQNLQRISGVSAKIQALLYAKGITKFDQLANLDEAQVHEVLEQAARSTSLSPHELYQIWVEQARLIVAGNQPGLHRRQLEFRRQTRRDHLQRLWGLGPKTANALRTRGIETFEQLAALDPAQLEAMVKTSHGLNGLSPRVLYTTWSELAQLAADSTWDEFEAQERYLQAQYGVLHDDLQQIRGIGPELDRVLRAQGIESFAALARIEASRLDAILSSAGLPTHLLGASLHRSWTEQARLAVDGDWEMLEAQQFEFGWWNNLEALSVEEAEADR